MKQFVKERQRFWTEFAKDKGVRRLATITATKEYEASHDHLTMLLNRRGVQEIAESNRKLIIRLRKNTNRHICAVLDLKGLKKINTEHGYSAGDKYVRKSAKIIRGVFHRPLDITGRIGGDEFIIICFNTDETLFTTFLDKLKNYSQKQNIFFHIAYSSFKAREKIPSVMQYVTDKTEEAKKTLAKDITGRLVPDTTDVRKI